MIWALSAFLTFNLHASALDLTPQGLYRATSEACSRVSEADLDNIKFDKLNAGYFPSREFTEIQNFIRAESARSAAFEFNGTHVLEVTKRIAEDSEFNRALEECYPHSPRIKKFFVNSIYRSDRAGRIVGISAVIVIFKGTGALFEAIGAWGIAATRYLAPLARGSQAFLTTQMIEGDTDAKGKIPSWEKADKDARKEELQKLAAQEKSMREQILTLQNKIADCRDCGDASALALSKVSLESLLKSISVENQNLNK